MKKVSKNLKRIISFTSIIVTAAPIVATGVIPLNSIVIAAETSHKPKINSVVLDKTEVSPGDSIRMTVNTDGTPGIECIFITLYNEFDTADSSSGYVEYNIPYNGDIKLVPDDSGKLTADIKINSSYKNGTYKILSMGVKYTNGNYVRFPENDDAEQDNSEYDNPLKDVEFIVKNSSGEYNGPEVKSVTFSKTSYNVEETGHVSVTLADGNDDIKSADLQVGFNIHNEFLKTNRWSFDIHLTPDDSGALEADFTLPKNNVAEYSIDDVYALDDGYIVYGLLSVTTEDNFGSIRYYDNDSLFYEEARLGNLPSNNISEIESNQFIVRGFGRALYDYDGTKFEPEENSEAKDISTDTHNTETKEGPSDTQSTKTENDFSDGSATEETDNSADTSGLEIKDNSVKNSDVEEKGGKEASSDISSGELKKESINNTGTKTKEASKSDTKTVVTGRVKDIADSVSYTETGTNHVLSIQPAEGPSNTATKTPVRTGSKSGSAPYSGDGAYTSGQLALAGAAGISIIAAALFLHKIKKKSNN